MTKQEAIVVSKDSLDELNNLKREILNYVRELFYKSEILSEKLKQKDIRFVKKHIPNLVWGKFYFKHLPPETIEKLNRKALKEWDRLGKVKKWSRVRSMIKDIKHLGHWYEVRVSCGHVLYFLDRPQKEIMRCRMCEIEKEACKK